MAYVEGVLFGRNDVGLKHELEAMRLFESINDDERLAWATNNIGDSYFQLGDYAQSIPYFR
jgi:hypothetical protein